MFKYYCLFVAFFSENGNLLQNIFFLFASFIFYFSKKSIIQICKIIDKSVESNDSSPSHTFEFPIYQAEEEGEEDCDIPDELARLLEHESKALQPLQEPVEIINLGIEEEKKEVKIGTTLGASIKERLVKLLQEFADVFA